MNVKRIVQETVGNDPKYAPWIAEVDGSISNVLQMMAACATLPVEFQPYDITHFEFYFIIY